MLRSNPRSGVLNSLKSEDGDAVLELSRSMLERAESQQWEAVERLEAQRRPLLLALFHAGTTAAATNVLASYAEVVLEIDRAIQKLAELARENCSQELRRLDDARRACSAYQDAITESALPTRPR